MSDLQTTLLGLSLVALGFVLVSLILIVVVPLYLKKSSASCTQPAPGRIVDTNQMHSAESRRSSSTIMYAPIYEFVVYGQRYRKESTVYTTKQPPVGEERTIMVEPGNPDHFVDPIQQKSVLRIFKLIGWLFFGISMLIMAVCFALFLCL